MQNNKIEALNLDELYSYQEQLFKAELLTTDAKISDKIYEELDRVDERIREVKKHERAYQGNC